MDILKPPLLWIEGRCYRINPEDNINESKPRGDEWDETPEKYECLLEEPCDEDPNRYDITVTDSGRYKTVFHVARIYFAPIIGAKGRAIRELQEETRTIVRLPKNPSEHETLITGNHKRDVAKARRRIETKVRIFRRKTQATHFLCIPFNTPEIKQNFLRFKNQVLEKCGVRGVEEAIFQDPNKLHLTLATLVLTDNTERTQAMEVLQQCKAKVIDPLMEGNTVTVLLSGVEYMNDDPSEVDVLYARVLTNDILHTLVNDIVNYLADAGLFDKQTDRVKLHVTVMNTVFRTKGSVQRETFDARPILEMFSEFDFGEVTIDTIHLATRYTTSKTDGFYQSSTQVSLLM